MHHAYNADEDLFGKGAADGLSHGARIDEQEAESGGIYESAACELKAAVRNMHRVAAHHTFYRGRDEVLLGEYGKR